MSILNTIFEHICQSLNALFLKASLSPSSDRPNVAQVFFSTKGDKMNRIILLFMILSLIGCSKDKKNTDSKQPWGVTEPVIEGENNSELLLSDFEPQSVLALTDKIKFKKTKNVQIKIVTTCEDEIEYYSGDLKTTFYIYELVPKKMISNYDSNVIKPCSFNFELTDKNNNQHLFSLQDLRVSIEQNNINHIETLPETIAEKGFISMDDIKKTPYSVSCGGVVYNKLDIDFGVSLRKYDCLLYGQEKDKIIISKPFTINQQIQRPNLHFQPTLHKKKYEPNTTIDMGDLQITNDEGVAREYLIYKKDLFLSVNVYTHFFLGKNWTIAYDQLKLVAAFEENSLIKEKDDFYIVRVAAKSTQELSMSLYLPGLKDPVYKKFDCLKLSKSRKAMYKKIKYRGFNYKFEEVKLYPFSSSDSQAFQAINIEGYTEFSDFEFLDYGPMHPYKHTSKCRSAIEKFHLAHGGFLF